MWKSQFKLIELLKYRSSNGIVLSELLQSLDHLSSDQKYESLSDMGFPPEDIIGAINTYNSKKRCREDNQSEYCRNSNPRIEISSGGGVSGSGGGGSGSGGGDLGSGGGDSGSGGGGSGSGGGGSGSGGGGSGSGGGGSGSGGVPWPTDYYYEARNSRNIWPNSSFSMLYPEIDRYTMLHRLNTNNNVQDIIWDVRHIQRHSKAKGEARASAVCDKHHLVYRHYFDHMYQNLKETYQNFLVFAGDKSQEDIDFASQTNQNINSTLEKYIKLIRPDIPFVYFRAQFNSYGERFSGYRTEYINRLKTYITTNFSVTIRNNDPYACQGLSRDIRNDILYLILPSGSNAQSMFDRMKTDPDFYVNLYFKETQDRSTTHPCQTDRSLLRNRIHAVCSTKELWEERQFCQLIQLVDDL